MALKGSFPNKVVFNEDGISPYWHNNDKMYVRGITIENPEHYISDVKIILNKQTASFSAHLKFSHHNDTTAMKDCTNFIENLHASLTGNYVHRYNQETTTSSFEPIREKEFVDTLHSLNVINEIEHNKLISLLSDGTMEKEIHAQKKRDDITVIETAPALLQ